MEPITRGDAITKYRFHQLLREWQDSSADDRLADVDFGQTAWLHIADGGSVYRLNADTKRDGVTEYLKLVDQYGDQLQWIIITNQRGGENAVAFGPDVVRPQKFYLYLVE